jgi:hypothetical protein
VLLLYAFLPFFVCIAFTLTIGFAILADRCLREWCRFQGRANVNATQVR